MLSLTFVQSSLTALRLLREPECTQLNDLIYYAIGDTPLNVHFFIMDHFPYILGLTAVHRSPLMRCRTLL